jgi:hypothetical protein
VNNGKKRLNASVNISTIWKITSECCEVLSEDVRCECECELIPRSELFQCSPTMHAGTVRSAAAAVKSLEFYLQSLLYGSLHLIVPVSVVSGSENQHI